jgi:hypothetical protein
VIAETEYGPVPERKQGLDINNDSGLEFENSRSSNDTNSEAVRSAARPASSEPEQPPAKRRPGRPRKNVIPVVLGEQNNSGSAVAAEPVKRRPGRP